MGARARGGPPTIPEGSILTRVRTRSGSRRRPGGPLVPGAVGCPPPGSIVGAMTEVPLLWGGAADAATGRRGSEASAAPHRRRPARRSRRPPRPPATRRRPAGRGAATGRSRFVGCAGCADCASRQAGPGSWGAPPPPPPTAPPPVTPPAGPGSVGCADGASRAGFVGPAHTRRPIPGAACESLRARRPAPPSRWLPGHLPRRPAPAPPVGRRSPPRAPALRVVRAGAVGTRRPLRGRGRGGGPAAQEAPHRPARGSGRGGPPADRRRGGGVRPA